MQLQQTRFLRTSHSLAALADQGIEHSASLYDSQATRGIALTIQGMALELQRQLPAGRGHGMRGAASPEEHAAPRAQNRELDIASAEIQAWPDG